MRLQAYLLSDEEAQQDYIDRGRRLMLTCCVCECEGWESTERDYPLHRCNMRIPSCNDPEHSVCSACLQKISGDCVFPYQNLPCSGTFYKTKVGFDICCTQCQATSKLKDPGKVWTCSECNRRACGMCDEEICVCSYTSSHKAYSRLFFCNGMPLRKHLVTRSMIDNKLNTCSQMPWHHVECPSCATTIYKTNACNDIYHCGKSSVCNWCGYSSFPWEDGIPLDHWSSCQRWDVYLPWYECKDCDTESQECQVPEHQDSIQKLHRERYHTFIEVLRKEFPWYF